MHAHPLGLLGAEENFLGQKESDLTSFKNSSTFPPKFLRSKEPFNPN
jgi:hypothetical protein